MLSTCWRTAGSNASDADAPVGDLSSFSTATPSSSACARIVAKRESTGAIASRTLARHGVYFRASRRSNQGLKSPSVTRCTSIDAAAVLCGDELLDKPRLV